MTKKQKNELGIELAVTAILFLGAISVIILFRNYAPILIAGVLIHLGMFFNLFIVLPTKYKLYD